jgi:D-alanyl-D-alanine carboxypeptidase
MGDTIEITQDVYIAKDSRVKLGDKYTMRNLIDEMMLVSDNDAAYALAKHLGGDTLRFYDMMNEKAAYLGMTNTHFANPNGVPNLNNYSTASDLVRLSRYSMRDSLFAAIVGTTEKDIHLLDGRHMPCRNTNALLTTYEGCLGIKTGFTRQAGNCLASAATRNGVTLYLVLLNSRSMSSRFKESAILLDYGFNVMKAYPR